MSNQKTRTPIEEKTSKEGIEAVKKHAEKLRKENAGRTLDEDEPDGLIAGGEEYLDADLEDEDE